jgi:hypothetical protein
MRGSRTFLDWLPLLFASTMVFLKLLGMATIFIGFPLAMPLLLLVIIDVMPFALADTARKLFFDTRGPAPQGILFRHVAMLALTAVQWYVVGVLVRRWLVHRDSPAVPVRFR